MKKNFLANMTWQEFASALNKETIMVIPMGSVELEGLHLPLGTDTIMAEGLAQRLSKESKIIICPSLPIGYSKWFMPFPGTITVEQETLVLLILDYCRCLITHGARRILFLNSHAGNNSAIEAASRILQNEVQVILAMIDVWRLTGDLISDKNIIDERRFTHAGELMTSVIMALRPESVIVEKMIKDKVKSDAQTKFQTVNSLGAVIFKNSTQTIYRKIEDLTETGTMGDPSTSTPQKGQLVLELVLEYVKAFIAELRKL
jgi:creatinine amidohydrolase